jgi:hypothetical protein
MNGIRTALKGSPYKGKNLFWFYLLPPGLEWEEPE